jgi:hypothetical protein
MPSLLTSSVSVAGSRIVATTFQPWSEKSFAVAFPTPEEAPVIKTVFGISCFIVDDCWLNIEGILNLSLLKIEGAVKLWEKSQ